jgi:hypothetical protein
MKTPQLIWKLVKVGFRIVRALAHVCIRARRKCVKYYYNSHVCIMPHYLGRAVSSFPYHSIFKLCLIKVDIHLVYFYFTPQLPAVYTTLCPLLSFVHPQVHTHEHLEPSVHRR